MEKVYEEVRVHRGPDRASTAIAATPLRREQMARSVVEGQLSKARAAQVYDVSPKIVTRWVERIVALWR